MPITGTNKDNKFILQAEVPCTMNLSAMVNNDESLQSSLKI
jgi:hypothetical protein